MPLWSVNRHRQSLSRSNDSLRFRHRPYAFDTSSVVPLRSSSCQAPDLVLPRPFPSVLTTMAFEPQPPKVVWNLLLQAGSEGPTLIDQAVTHIGSSSALCARGAQSPANRRRRNLRDVDRRHHRGASDSDASAAAARQDPADGARQSGANRRQREQRRGGEKYLLPAKPVARKTRQGCAGDATQQEAARGKLGLRSVQREVPLQEHDRPIDARRVNPEQKPADRRNQRGQVNMPLPLDRRCLHRFLHAKNGLRRVILPEVRYQGRLRNPLELVEVPFQLRVERRAAFDPEGGGTTGPAD